MKFESKNIEKVDINSIVKNQKKSNKRLLNKLFTDKNFFVDENSVGYIIRDIINMNWWNTCDYLIGYKNNARVSSEYATYKMKLVAIILKEFYRHNQLKKRDPKKLDIELNRYLNNETNYLRQLKLYSMPYRKNDSQYFYKNGEATWLDCTSRATYAWKYVAQNGYIDFDGICRVKDANIIIDHCKYNSVYPDKNEILKLFNQGKNNVKAEIFSQKDNQLTVSEWVNKLGISVIDSRKWLFEKIKNVRTDPYKNYEKALFKKGELTGVNETLYGYKTSFSILPKNMEMINKYQFIFKDSINIHASRASRASSASDASRASHASDASSAGIISIKHNVNTWFKIPSAIGKLKNLDHPPMFLKNKFGLAGHWKIDKNVVSLARKGWLDVFFGHGESALYAKRNNINFTGIEINPDSMNGYILPYIKKSVDEFKKNNAKINLILGDSSVYREELKNKFDLCYTSPPYFNFEDYGFHNKVISDCINYDEYHKRVTIPVFSNVHKYLTDNGVLALQVEKNKKLKEKWITTLSSIGFSLISDNVTGQEENKYSKLSKRDQNLLLFEKK